VVGEVVTVIDVPFHWSIDRWFGVSDGTIHRIISKRELIAQLRSAVRAAQVAVAARDQAIGELLGVNATDHRCLDLLDQRGSMTPSTLAAALGLTRSATTTVIDRLQALGYVRRAPSAQDRRQVLVELTPLLRRRAGELYGDQGEVQAALERYSVAELTLLLEFVRWDRDFNERRVRDLTDG
jgi:DNA-binding MarR family transcriptional regulator